MGDPAAAESCVRIHVQIQVTEAYEHSPLTVSAWSSGTDPFELEVRGDGGLDVVGCEIGAYQRPDRRRVRSQNKDGRQLLAFTVVGAFKEQPIFEGETVGAPQTALGVRWFPFVSSRLQMRLSAGNGSIVSVDLDISAQLRMRRGFNLSATVDPPRRLRYHNRLVDNAWAHTLWWDSRGAQHLTLDVPLHVANHETARTLGGATVGLIAVLTAITIAGYQKNASQLVAAAFGGYVLVLIRQWSVLPRIQNLTAIGAVYLVCLGLTIPWAWFWGHGERLVLLELVLIVPWTIGLLLSLPHFDAIGRPPIWFAKPFRALSRSQERTRERRRDAMQLAALLQDFDVATAQPKVVGNVLELTDGGGAKLQIRLVGRERERVDVQRIRGGTDRPRELVRVSSLMSVRRALEGAGGGSEVVSQLAALPPGVDDDDTSGIPT